MSNINFDNAYLLLLIIPLVAVVIVPFALAVRKDNANGHNIASCVLHVLIAVLVGFAIAGTSILTVMTETEVYVVADVSYSASRNLDTVDRYVQNVREALPANSKMGVVAFGRDCELICELGGENVSVKTADVDDSATDISGALTYASGLFHDGVIKRIVLITDGGDSSPEQSSGLAGTINALYDSGIYVDAIFVDDNLPDGTHEVQVTDAEFSSTAFAGRQSGAYVTVNSGSVRNAVVTLSVSRTGEDGVREELPQYSQSTYPTLSVGTNVFNFDLCTDEPGTYNYTVAVSCEDEVNTFNDSYSFTQTVHDKMKVAVIAQSYLDTNGGEDLDRLRALYGDDAEVDEYIVVGNVDPVPSIVEDLCEYDQIVLANTDITALSNYSAFIDALNTLVSSYGKTLLTFGNTSIQSKDDDSLTALQDMLPSSFGGNNADDRNMIFVVDNSYSMDESGYMAAVKNGLKLMIERSVSSDSSVTIIAFWGSVRSIRVPSRGEVDSENYNQLMDFIDDFEGMQATDIGLGLNEASKYIVSDKVNEICLISDGRNYDVTAIDPISEASGLFAQGVLTNCLYVGPSDAANPDGISEMRRVAAAGCGNDPDANNYYECTNPEDIGDVVVGEYLPSVNDYYVVGDTAVNVELAGDEALEGIASVPDIGGYFYGRLKNSATNVLTVDYDTGRVDGDGNPVTVEVPLYSYWSYGNGRVASFSSSLGSTSVGSGWVGDFVGSGDDTQLAEGSTWNQLLRNILFTNTPEQHVDYPYLFNLEYTGGYASAEIRPAHAVAAASAVVTVTSPDGSSQEYAMAFNGTQYSYGFLPEDIGTYSVRVTYTVEGKQYTSSGYIDIPYLAEYDSFEYFSPSTLNLLLAGRGTVSEDGSIQLINPEDELDTYSLYLTLPLLIAAVSLFVVDIIIRKLKWNDIKSLFVKIK